MGESLSKAVGGGGRPPSLPFREAFARLICSAQETVRQLAGGERSSASLRDVQRCIKVFGWFLTHLSGGGNAAEGEEAKDEVEGGWR